MIILSDNFKKGLTARGDSGITFADREIHEEKEKGWDRQGYRRWIGE
jgi:hypothetical protein